MATWRQKMRDLIAPVLQEHPEPGPDRNKALRQAYPFPYPWNGGPSWQYKVWRDEIARQIGTKPPLYTRNQNPDKETGRCSLTLDLFAPEPTQNPE